MQSAFEKIIADQEKRRNDFMEQFYTKYAVSKGDSDDELVDFKTFTVTKKKGKLGMKYETKLGYKHVKTKVVKFGDMNSYSISFESKAYLKQIRKCIESNEACIEKFAQHNDGEESKLLVTSKICANHTKRDSFKDDNWTMSNEDHNKTLPLYYPFNRQFLPLRERYLDNVKLDCLTFKQDKHIKNSTKCINNNVKLDCLTFKQDKHIKNSTKCINNFKILSMSPIYSPHSKTEPVLDALHEVQTVKNNISEREVHQKATETKCNDLNLKLSNKSLTPRTDDNLNSHNFKECSVLLNRNVPPKYFKSLESRSDVVLSQSIAISSQFNAIKESIPVNQKDKHAQKSSGKKYTHEKLLCKNYIRLTILKRLRPRSPKAGSTTLMPCSCNRCVLSVDEIAVSGGKQQNNSNFTVSEMNVLSSKDVCTPQTKAYSKPRKLFADRNVGHQNISSNTYLTEKISVQCSSHYLKSRKMCTQSECPGAEISDNCSKKIVSTLQDLKKYSRHRSIFSSNTYTAKNNSCPKSVSVTKLNRKCLQNFDMIKIFPELKKSQHGMQRDIFTISQNNSFDDIRVVRKKSKLMISECSVKDDLQGVSNIPYKQFFTPQFPKILPMKPITGSPKFAPNLPVDCLTQN